MIKFDEMSLYHIGNMMVALGRLTREKHSELMLVWRKCDEADSWKAQVKGDEPSNASFVQACRIYASVIDDVEEKGIKANLFKRGDWPFDSQDDEFVQKVRLEVLARLGVDIRPSVHEDDE